MNISDKDLLSSGLFAIKHMTMVYNNTATETDDPQLAKELCQMISDEHTARIKLYEAMQQRGWYNAQLIDQQQLHNAQQQISQQVQQMVAQSSQSGAYQQQWQGATAYSQPGYAQQSGQYQPGYSQYQTPGSNQQQGTQQYFGQQTGFPQPGQALGVQPRSNLSTIQTPQHSGQSQ